MIRSYYKHNLPQSHWNRGTRLNMILIFGTDNVVMICIQINMKLVATVQNDAHYLPSIYRLKSISVFEHNCCVRSLFMEKKPEVSKAVPVLRRDDVITGLCHSVSSSLSGCLNWPMLCQLWTEVWLRLNMWLLLLWRSSSVPRPGMREDLKLGRGERDETQTWLIGVCVWGVSTQRSPFSTGKSGVLS